MTNSSTSSNDTKLQTVENDLARISTTMVRNARITAFIGAILMVAMLGYFVFGFNEIEDLTRPENLVALAGQVVNGSLPEIRESVQESVKTSAPDWAQAVSDQAIGATPTIRRSLEDHILAQSNEVISNGVTLGETEFRRILRDNRTAFEQTLDELAEGEEYSEETLLIFLSAVNQEMGRDMEDQAEEVLGTLIALNDKLQKLSANQSLNREEALERQTLMVIRRLQIQEQDAQILARKKAAEEAAAAARAESARAELDSDDPDSGAGDAEVSGDAEVPVDSEEEPRSASAARAADDVNDSTQK